MNIILGGMEKIGEAKVRKSTKGNLHPDVPGRKLESNG